IHEKTFQYYSDQYDRYTVDQCRRAEQSWKEKKAEPVKDKKISKKQAARINEVAMEFALHFKIGERYLNKEKTIQEWMEADQKKDDLYESAQAPKDIRCLI